MKPVFLSTAAQFDLKDISDYIAKDNPHRASSFVNEIAKRCREIGEFPESARRVRVLGSEVRVLPHRGYIIVYRNHHDRVTVERVLHGARDILSLLEELMEGD